MAQLTPVQCPVAVSDDTLDLLLEQLERRLSAEWDAVQRLVGRMGVTLTLLAATPAGLALGTTLKGIPIQPELEVVSIAIMFTAALVALAYNSARNFDFPPGAELLYYLANQSTRDIKWTLVNSLVSASKRNVVRLEAIGRALNIALLLFVSGTALFALAIALR